MFKRLKARRQAKKEAKLAAIKAENEEKEKVVKKESVATKPKTEEAKVTKTTESPKKEAPKVEKTPTKNAKEEVAGDDLEDVEKEAAEIKAKKRNAKYHVSQNKDEKSQFFKQWRVRKEGSKKTIKYFATQLEAIAYAEDLAKKNDSSVVIHKVDGSIRKQDYTKK